MPLFWNSPSSLFWGSASSLFWVTAPTWTQTAIGGSTGSFSSSSGTYTVGGSGTGVSGTADSIYLVSQPATGNIEFISYVSAQSSSNAYAIAGLMLTDSLTSNDAQCALVSVSPQNGVNFSFRTADGGTADTTLGPSIATPIWLRLVVSQTSVAGYQSPDGIAWQLVGEATMTLPTNFYVGFAVSSNSAAVNTATFSNQYYLTDVVQRSANLVSWLRADVGVTYDSSSDLVSLWYDQSSNGFNASQSDSNNQPIVVTAAVNGLPAIQFTPGANGQFLQFPDGFDFTSGLSLFAVVKPTTLSANATILDFRNFSGSSSSDQFGVCELNSTSGAIFYAYAGSAGSSGSFSSALTANQFQLLEVIYDGVSSVSVYNNGALVGTQGGLQTLNNVTRNSNNIGQSGNGSNFFTGQIAEVLIYDTDLDDALRESVEGYLLNKFSL
ncbi:MAG TPA: LamG-like jellyroll fold domain-containing protein [Oculatellaceae cyanobacterium]